MPTLRAFAVALLVVVAAGACSSTADPTAQSRRRSSAGDLTTQTDDPLLDDPATTDAPGGAPGSTSRPTRSRSGGRSSGGASGSGGAGSGPGGAQGPAAVSQGVTDKEIFIGISTAQDFDTVAATYGISDSDSQSDRAKAEAVVNAVNASGGIAGRKVVPVFHDISAAGNFDSEAQAACAKWTQDNKVFAALAWLYDRETLVSCLAKRNTPLLKSSFQIYDDQTAGAFAGYLYQHDFLFGNRWGIYVDRLVARGFLKPEHRVGLLRLDTPEHARTADGTVKPRLAAQKLNLVDEIAVKKFNGAGEAVSDTASAVGNAVLRFRSANIDRVLILDIGGVLGQFFMTHAESQGYRPKYGLNSINRPEFLVNNVPAAQLAGAAGAGWWPIEDTGQASGGQPGEKRCAEVLRAAGLGADDFTGLSYCSRLFFLQAALDGQRDVTPAALRAGADRLGTGFSSALTQATSYAGGRYDGVGAVRDFVYDPGCGCFAYTGGLVPVG